MLDDMVSFSVAHQTARFSSEPKEVNSMAWFFEIRSSINAVLKRDGGFPNQDATEIAGREVARKMRHTRQPERPDVGRILVGRNAEKFRDNRFVRYGDDKQPLKSPL